MVTLAREGARYACVRGSQYQAGWQRDGGQPRTDVYNNAILPMTAGLDPASLTYNVSWTTSNAPLLCQCEFDSSPANLLANTVYCHCNIQLDSGSLPRRRHNCRALPFMPMQY